MLLRTHIAIAVFGILLFIPFVNSVNGKIIFSVTLLIATLIPDVDSKFSEIGKRKIFRPFQFFLKHRGVLHSFTFLILVTLFFVLFFPILSLGFFLGYGLHLFADAFTVDGIKPFYPLQKISSGFIKVGTKTEITIFVFFILADLFLLIFRIKDLF